MAETFSETGRINAADVNPFNIGGGDLLTKGVEYSPNLRKKEKISLSPRRKGLTKEEIEDLRKIDPNGISLKDVKEFAIAHLKYYTSMGRVNFQGPHKRNFNESKAVVSWLANEKYSQLASFFLQKARSEWRGMGYYPEEKDEVIWKVMEADEIATTPKEIIFRGDSAIQEFHRQQGHGLVLRMASRRPETYLRQASVLARIIKSD